MKLTIHVNTNTKREKVEKIDEKTYRIKFFAVREKGKANEKLVEILSEYFNVSKNSIKILHGHTNSTKLVQIG